MKALKHILTLSVVFVLSLFLVNCEKVNPEMDMVADPGTNAAQMKAAEISSNPEIIYLISLIEDIESLVEEGILNKGQANALIVKIENAIKSLENGNDNAAENQLTALINQTEDFVETGILTEEQGESLINSSESAIILSEGSFIDPRDGYEYKVVLIGDQIWMAENLRATAFNDGTEIPLIEDNTSWLFRASPAHCWYDNDEETYSEYGPLYNWHTIEAGGFCPPGWHIPNVQEWTILIDYLGGAEIAGGKLKETGSTHWIYFPYGGATNETGFTGLPGGRRLDDGEFLNIGTFGLWWSSRETLYLAWNLCLQHDGTNVLWWTARTTSGKSVRCIKD